MTDDTPETAPQGTLDDPAAGRSQILATDPGDDAALARIGRCQGTDNPFYLDLTKNTYLWGQKGSGTTTLILRIIAAAVKDPECAVWLIDPERGAGDRRSLLKPLVDRRTDQPPVDWLACTPSQAAAVARTAANAAVARAAAASAAPRILIVVASMSEAGDDRTAMMDDLAKVGALGRNTGISMVFAAKRAPSVVLTPGVRACIDTYITLRESDPWLAGTVFGEAGEKYATDPNVPLGTALIGNRDRSNIVVLDRVTAGLGADGWTGTCHTPTITDRAVTSDLDYVYRWQRTLPNLFPAGVPDRLARLGLPALPNNPETASDVALAHALHESPSVSSGAQAAAAELLINACDGQLLRAPGVRQAMAMDGGLLYVRWTSLADLAERRSSLRGYENITHPDGQITLQLIAHLATGGLTKGTAALLADVLKAQS